MKPDIPASLSYELAVSILSLMPHISRNGSRIRRKLEAVRSREEKCLRLFERWKQFEPPPEVNILLGEIYPEENPFWAEYQELSLNERRELWRWLHGKKRRIKPLNASTRFQMQRLIMKMQDYASRSNTYL
jgi:hypothetical protein